MAFVPGAFGVTADYNFISSMALNKPDIDPQLTEAFGSQYLSGFLTLVGAEKATSSMIFDHFEEDRIMPKLYATTAGAVANAAATFTLNAAAKISISPQNPYAGSVTEDIIVPRVGDVIQIKPSSGVVASGSYIQALVTAVSATAGTFVAYPTTAGDAIPNISSAEEIIIIGNASGEGSGQPESAQSRVTKKSGNIQIMKETHSITGTAKDIVLWTEVPGANGKKGYFWSVKGEADAYKRFMNKKELTFLTGTPLTNDTLADVYATTPVAMTKGLIPSILDDGNTFNYSSSTSFTKADAEAMIKTLDKQKGSKSNMLAAGINLSIALDNMLADYNVNGAIVYGNYTMGQEASRAFEFKSFSIGGYTLNKKTFDAMNDLQTLGADGFGYANEAFVIPMDMKMDAKTGERIQALRTRYLVGENGERYDSTTAIDRFKVDGNDKFDVYYKAACGLETFALNRFGYIKQA